MSCLPRWTGRTLFVIALGGTGYVASTVARARDQVWVEPAPAAALGLDSTSVLVVGPPDAPVIVRIFGDYGCPACQRLDRETTDSLLALARNGRLRLVYLQRPLAASTAGEAFALAVACAPAQRAWEVHRHLYRARERARPADVRLPESLTASPDFQACVASDEKRAAVRSAIAATRRAGFHEVPVVLVNDERVLYRSHAGLLRHIMRAIP